MVAEAFPDEPTWRLRQGFDPSAKAEASPLERGIACGRTPGRLFVGLGEGQGSDMEDVCALMAAAYVMLMTILEAQETT